MAGFKTHITVSSTLGVGYGLGAFFGYGVPAPSCVLAGTLCGLSGMLPDLDSDSGTPLRESISFAAATLPMLLIERFNQLHWTPETMALVGAGIYAAVRFGLAKIVKKLTVHRGMFHSIPAAFIAAEIFYLIASANEPAIRLYKAGGVFAGFMSHLILDEIWSVSFKGGVPRLKSSFGTAVKFIGDGFLPNLATYSQLIALTYFVLQDSQVIDQLQQRNIAKPTPKREAAEQFAEDVWRRVVR
jgi:membrane-bound metal-dependent hydrolase YbcI (DUF457 family)